MWSVGIATCQVAIFVNLSLFFIA